MCFKKMIEEIKVIKLLLHVGEAYCFGLIRCYFLRSVFGFWGEKGKNYFYF